MQRLIFPAPHIQAARESAAGRGHEESASDIVTAMSPPALRSPLARRAPDPARYATYRLWLDRCLHRLERAHGSAARGLLAAQMGCTPGHLNNILKGRRRLGSPYLENLILAFDLSEAQKGALLLLVEAAHGAPRARAAAKRGLEAQLLAAAPRAVTEPSPNGSPLNLLTLEALALRDVVDAGPRELAAVLLPPTLVHDIGRLTMSALKGRPLTPTPALRALGPLEKGEIPTILDALRRARYALEVVPLGRRLVRTSVWLTSSEGWAEAVSATLATFQRDLRAWAAALPVRGQPCAVFHVGAQLTPLTRPVEGAGRPHQGAPVWVGSVVRTDSEAPASPALIAQPVDDLPSTYRFDDYRVWFRAWFTYKKQQAAARNRTFTMGQIAQRMGCSPSLISSLLSGARHLQEKHLPELGKALWLSPQEAQDLDLLWRYTLEPSRAGRARLLTKRLALPGFREARPLDAARMWAVSDPLPLTVLELARHPAFQEDPLWIRQQLYAPSDDESIARSLQTLRQIGALRPNAEGRLELGATQFWMESSTQRDLMTALHLALLDRVGAEACAAPEQVWWSAQALLIPLSAVDALAERVRTLHAQLAGALEAAELNSPAGTREVRLLTLQHYPGTRDFKP